MHENRETSSPTDPKKGSPAGKGQGRNASAYGGEESDGVVVPMNPSNKAQAAHAEAAEREEGRTPTKENVNQAHTLPAQNGRGVSQGLAGVRKVAKENKQEKFTTLLHHLNIDLLRRSFLHLKKQAAPGVDGVTWGQYEQGLEDRLTDLNSRVHRGTYRAQPSRRIYIPKAEGKQRPIGIAALEDKIVQQAVVTILNEIYEVDFRGFSYGFRPGRSQHDALDALSTAIQSKKVNYVVDADIQAFFDRMKHEWAVAFLQHRVADQRIVRLVQKWLKAGISEDGEWSKTEVGTPQGAVISPLLANIYLHYVFDLWLEVWRQKVATGDVVAVRYADDVVVGFQHRAEAERFLKDFQERLAKFGLELHPDKTRLIEFGRFAQAKRRERGEGEAETFTFLGFTHKCGTNKNGSFVVWRTTVKKRLEAKLQDVKLSLQARMHEPLRQTAKWLRSVVQGYYQYFAVPGNLASLETFRQRIFRYWWRVLNRRSQRGWIPAERATRLISPWLPSPKVLHPYPLKRFCAKHPR